MLFAGIDNTKRKYARQAKSNLLASYSMHESLFIRNNSMVTSGGTSLHFRAKSSNRKTPSENLSRGSRGAAAGGWMCILMRTVYPRSWFAFCCDAKALGQICKKMDLFLIFERTTKSIDKFHSGRENWFYSTLQDIDRRGARTNPFRSKWQYTLKHAVSDHGLSKSFTGSGWGAQVADRFPRVLDQVMVWRNGSPNIAQKKERLLFHAVIRDLCKETPRLDF